MNGMTKYLPTMLPFGYVVLVLATTLSGQEFRVRTEPAPYFVGESISLEVEAIDFDDEPVIVIQNQNQPGMRLAFEGSGRQESMQLYQSGGKLVRNRVVKIVFRYRIEFEKPGKYSVGPFETEAKGKKISQPAIEYEVRDIETSDEMHVAIEFPSGNFYPGQRIPVVLKWTFEGSTDSIAGLTIRTPFFDEMTFAADPAPGRRRSSLPISTRNGPLNLPAEFSRTTRDGKTVVVGTAKRILIAERPGKFDFGPIFVTFQKIVGVRRSRDPFDLFERRTAETRPFRGIGEPVRFEVKAFPASGRPAGFQGAVGKDFRISTSVNRRNVRTGDPLTLQINIEGKGNIRDVLPPKLGNSLSAEEFDWPNEDVPGVVADNRKQFNVTLRVKSTTVKFIPEIEFAWFDPDSESYHTIKSARIDLDVQQGDVVSSADIVGTAPGSQDASLRDSQTRIDLSVSADVSSMVRQSETGQSSLLPWIFHLGGIGVVIVAILVRRARRPPDPQTLLRERIRHQLQSVKQSGMTVARLCAALRDLQSSLNDFIQNDPLPSDLTDELDQLIGDCDAVAYRRAATETADNSEVDGLLDRAKELTTTIADNLGVR